MVVSRELAKGVATSLQEEQNSSALQAAPSAQAGGNASLGTGTLGKAFDVVSAIAAAEHPPRFTDLLKVLDQPRGTLHRQITNLLEENLIAMNRATNCYTLGPRLLQLAAHAWRQNDLRQVAETHIKQLNAKAGETVHLGILQGSQVVYLDKMEAAQALRMHSQIGRSAPLYCTGVGKAILMGLPEEKFEELVGAMEFQKFTPTTLTSVRELRDDRSKSRQRGYAADEEEHEAGIRCVAAPILTADGELVGAVSVTAPSYRIGADTFSNWTRWIQQTAEAIGADVEIKMSPRR